MQKHFEAREVKHVDRYTTKHTEQKDLRQRDNSEDKKVNNEQIKVSESATAPIISVDDPYPFKIATPQANNLEKLESEDPVEGVLEVLPDGYGFLKKL